VKDSPATTPASQRSNRLPFGRGFMKCFMLKPEQRVGQQGA
jgi:hypothetical protein